MTHNRKKWLNDNGRNPGTHLLSEVVDGEGETLQNLKKNVAQLNVWIERYSGNVMRQLRRVVPGTGSIRTICLWIFNRLLFHLRTRKSISSDEGRQIYQQKGCQWCQ